MAFGKDPMHHLLLLPLLLWAAPALAESISGVCPDGSIFIVQQPNAIPCRGAKRVEPGDIPPIQPEYLPRPYGWEVFNRETDPNNPYNVIDTARPGARPNLPPVATGAPPPVSAPPTVSASPPVSAPPPVATAPPPDTSASFALAPHELDDLAAIIEVLQRHAPATLVQQGAAGPGLEVRLARSGAFEARVSEVLAGRGAAAGGPVVAFHVLAHEPSAFFGNLTFVQGHMAFVPDTADASQFGLVEGRLGPIRPGERVLGYAVLPAHTDLAQPIDVYWDDRRLTAVLNP
jgi:hypothetical protein